MELVPEEIDDFMWMFEVELEDGAPVQAYKHWWTRRYLHLDFAGRAFVFTEDNLYEEVDPGELVAAVLNGRESRAAILAHEGRVDDSKIEWAPSAARHGISFDAGTYVVKHAGLCFEAEGREDDFHPRLYFFGKDETDAEIEVVAVELRNERLLVVHAMAMKRPFGLEYVEAIGWRR